MSSYFTAWLDYQNLYSKKKKKYVTAFTPRANMDKESMETYFDVYPDGFLISVVRDPLRWYSSASKHDEIYQDIENSMNIWKLSTESSLKIKEKHPDRVILIDFNDLIENTEDIMKKVCKIIDIKYNDLLIESTFNGINIGSNSSYGISTGIDKNTVRRKIDLNNDIQIFIRENYMQYFDSCIPFFKK